MKTFWLCFILLLLLSLVAEYFITPAVPFFYAAYGFLACAAIIIISKLLGYFLKRPVGYYGETPDV